jgi:hypothetical protein
VAEPSVVSCAEPPDTSLHWEVVFGHTTSLAQAILLRRPLATMGFKGILFEKDSCDDVELEVPGLDDYPARQNFLLETSQVQVSVVFEPPANEQNNAPDEVSAVFGDLPTLKRASVLQQAVADVGFHDFNDIERLGIHDWRVVVTHVPKSGMADFAAKAKSAGFRITFTR